MNKEATVKRQKSMIVSEERGTDRLNEYLDNGWMVVQMCAMPSSIACATGSSYPIEKRIYPTCLVVLEIEEDVEDDV